MVKKENRLKKRKQFNYLFKHGKSEHVASLTLIYLPCKCKDFKIGYSVSKKVGKAVFRNKVKRRLKEAFYKISKNVKNNHFYILIPKPEIANLTFEEICNLVPSVFRKANLLNE